MISAVPPARADHRPGNQQPASGAPRRAKPGEGGDDDLRVAELGQRGISCGIGVQALVQVVLAGLVEPVGQLLDDRAGQLRRQGCQVAADRAGSGHGLPSRAAPITAAKSRQSARFPDSACAPAGVSR
jgi:hypothetical protein